MNINTKNITSEKLEKLTARYKDKSLTRAERQEVMEEISWERFRADPRPAMPLRKFKLLDAVVYLADTIIFAYIGIGSNSNIKKHDGFNGADLFMVVTVALLFAMVVFYLNTHSRYKIEPMDEMAHRSMNTASNRAFHIMVAVGIAASYIMFVIDSEGSVTVKNNSMIQILCALVFFYSFLSNIIFVYLERGDGSGSDEEEDD